MPSTPILDARHEDFEAVMALVLDPQAPASRGVVRCITHRQGDPSAPGFVDKSELRLAEKRDGAWHVGGPLPIAGLAEYIEAARPPKSLFLGLEDPDLFLVGDVLHLFFTVPFLNPEGTSHISLGHATGPDLQSLTVQPPVLEGTPGISSFKEVCIGPVNADGRRYVLTESSDQQQNTWYSTMALGLAPADLAGPWEHHLTAVHPLTVRQVHAAHDQLPGSYDWCAEHVSPAFFFPRKFADHGQLLVGLMNARSQSGADGTFGKFLPGLFLFDPETGYIPWVDPFPLFDDPAARNIIFASDFAIAADGRGQLYAHLDDERIVAYELLPELIHTRLPKSDLI